MDAPDFAAMPDGDFFMACTEFLDTAAANHPHRAAWIEEAKRRHAAKDAARRARWDGYLDLREAA